MDHEQAGDIEQRPMSLELVGWMLAGSKLTDKEDVQLLSINIRVKLVKLWKGFTSGTWSACSIFAPHFNSVWRTRGSLTINSLQDKPSNHQQYYYKSQIKFIIDHGKHRKEKNVDI